MGTDNIFDHKRKPDALLKKFPNRVNSIDQKRVRIILLLVFGFSVLLIGGAIGIREMPRLLKAESKKSLVISETIQIPQATPTPISEKEKMRTAIEEIIQPLRGKYGIYFFDLTSMDGFSINGKEKFTAASLMKLPVMLLMYRDSEAKRIDLDKVYRLKAADKRQGAGSLGLKEVGYEISYRKIVQLMGEQSDNTAYQIARTTVGDERTQQLIDLLGMKNTSVVQGVTTPEDITLFFKKIYTEKVINENDTEQLLGFLTGTIWEDRIPAGIPSGIKVAHKIGTEIGVISDAGIIFSPKPFILAILTQDADEIEAKKLLPEITAKIYQMFVLGN